jgi:cytochrome c oxidase assembly factor CtaG
LIAEVPDNLATAWTFPLWPCLSLLLAGLVYLRGWQRAHHTQPIQLPLWRAIAFFLGIASVWIAIGSPINALDDLLLSAHMTQHLILMSVAPPLILLGAPTVPLLRGLPRSILRAVIGPLLRARWFRKLIDFLKHPIVGWLAMNVAFIGWHSTRAFELALRSETWHTVEHLCFFLTSLAFWWTVIQPWPSKAIWSRWIVILYLLTADLVNTGLSAFLAFCGRVLYPTYATAPRVFRLSPLNDQIAAGAGMWLFGSLIFLIAAAFVLFRLLSPLTPALQDKQSKVSHNGMAGWVNEATEASQCGNGHN